MKLNTLDRLLFKKTIILLIILMLSFPGVFLLSSEGKLQEIDKWLVLGPAPVSDAEKNLFKSDSAVINFAHIPVKDLCPTEGEKIRWGKEKILKWRILSDFNFSAAGTEILYAATYLETDRWLKAKLLLEKGDKDLTVSAFLNGKSISTGKDGDNISADLNLLNQKHILILKILLPKGEKVQLKGFLKKEKPFADEHIRLSLSPYRRVHEADILNTVSVLGISLSPNGKLAALSLAQTRKDTGSTERWREILNTSTGATVFTTADFGEMGGFKWLKDSLSFSFTRSHKGKTSIYIYHLKTKSSSCILENIKDFTTYWWSDDNAFLIYTISHREKREGGYKYIKEISDRSKYSGTSSSMYIFFPAGGVTRKIAGKDADYYTAIISPDSKKVILVKDDPDNKNRPYRKTIVHLFDVNTFKTEPLTESNWASPRAWSPDSKKVLFLGGPSSFGGIGKNLKEGITPNDYDIQAYTCDLDNIKDVRPISKNFAPNIDFGSWSSSANTIYFKVTEKSNSPIYRYSISKNTYRKLDTKVDVVENIDFARSRNIAVYWGSSAGVPQKLYTLNLSTGRSALLKDYNKEAFKPAQIGKVVPWDFVSKDGKNITGRIHYPLDFDKNKKYPCIVYYYGGTSPVDRSFGGRYPFNWYTAQGYIVYVLQPSGSVGFGQDFSAIHVNDWGEKASEEIITGVEELLKAHPYIDPGALGAMGASYGGFMTQYLATCTGKFAAFVSHAGISSLSSYWGIGDWGFTYSGIATADSFPWNRKDIYVGHSPLFMADRISTPLLLLHGDSDNNVPPGESYQMFAALKLLNKEVALVTFDKLSHLIMEYKKRLHWMRTIIAWFDKYLKKQPQFWNHLYPEK
ncbi:MAG: S9 family peptidase [Candidatus Aminicenantes bacterium]|nr:S9 family peptidase [Candidatus Aminicenantes bacterium]